MEASAEFLDLIAHKLKYLDAKARILAIESLDPLTAIVGSSWQQQLNNFGFMLTLDDQNLPKESDVLVICIKHETIAQVLSKLPQIVELPGWDTCQAVLQQNVYVMDEQIFSSSDQLKQLEIIAELIYPKLFAFGHEGDAWLKLNF